MDTSTFDRTAARLRAVRVDHGFGPSPGLGPEPEPSAFAALALDDAGACAGGRPEASAVGQTLSDELERTDLLGGVVALAWTALAAGSGLEQLRRAAA
jgi:hypothetical protein